MLLELTPEEVEQVTPIVPTWEQYIRYLGSAALTAQRIVIAIGVGAAFLLLSRVGGEGSLLGVTMFIAGMLTLLYPFFWGPLYAIARRNLAFRELPYSGLFFGKVLNVRRRTVVVEEREKVSEDGEVYIEEVRERQLEIEIGDKEGSRYTIRVRDEPRYDSIVKNQTVLAMVKAYSPDLQRRPVLSEVYIVKLNEWIGDVSYLKRDAFLELADELLAEYAS
ncbi:MAG: hypothetical protein Q6K99_06255 [Thermostichales cyanobacterium BF4_bins_65]